MRIFPQSSLVGKIQLRSPWVSIESGAEAPLQRNLARNSKLRRTLRMVVLVVAGVCGYVVWALAPASLRFAGDDRARVWQRQAAMFFLDGLLIAYGPALIVTVLGTVVLAGLRLRARGSAANRSRLAQARLLLLSVSILLSFLALETGAAAWHAWLHHSPSLPAITATPEDAPATTDAEPDPELPTRFLGSNANARPLRILVIGESSGRGEPYHPWLSAGHIVAWRLEQVFPGRPIWLDIWAYGGATLEAMHNKLVSLSYRPDALMVYVGHNEFQGRYTWMRDVNYYHDTDQGERAQPVPGANTTLSLSRFSPLCQLILEVRELQQVDIKPPRVVTRELVDRPVCTRAEAGELLADFRRRLSAIAAYCESIGTIPIVIIPASNDGGYDPSRSILNADTPKSERRAFAGSVALARAQEVNDRAAAVRTYRELVERHPEFAETHYRLARLLEQVGAWDEARAHYIQARECDALPLRCPEAFRQVFREVAASHPQVLLVDGPRVLEAQSPHGILDDWFFHDAQHPNLRGYAALAEDILNQLASRRAFGWPADRPVPVVDCEACIRHFQIDAARWIDICRREVKFYRSTAYVRYEPKFRNQRAAAYTRAAEALQAGRDPADAKIPGWPLPPRPSRHQGD
jgi:tetratricopeptide (TPR) repeat protein